MRLMPHKQNGFTLVELIVTCAVVALIGLSAAVTCVHTLVNIDAGKNRLEAISQVQAAAYWISCDTKMAESIQTDNLTGNDFIIFVWTDYSLTGGDSIYHTVTYAFNNLVDNTGDLIRTHISSDGGSTSTVVSRNLYFNSADPDTTCTAMYEGMALTVVLTCSTDDGNEKVQYSFNRRSDFTY